MTRTTLLTSTVMFAVLAAAGADVCRGDPPEIIEPGASQVAPTDIRPLYRPRVVDNWNSGCLLDDDGHVFWLCGDDEFEFTVEPNTLHVLHKNAAYNCCLDDIVISLSVEGNVLVLTEEEVITDYCYCICCYDVEATIIDLAPGDYIVEFYWYDYDTQQVECYVEEIEIPGGGQPDSNEPPVTGDPGDSQPAPVDLKPVSRPRVEEWWHSDCLDYPDDPNDWWPCEGDDQIVLTVEGRSLHVHHMNATYNCCLDDILISLEAEENLLRLTEEEILTNPCWCICCYDAAAIVVDLAPGTYTVEFCWFDYQTYEERCYIEEIVIP